MWRLILSLCAPALVSASLWGETQKKLIEFGWDEPDTQFMREHIEEMERSPFDGCVFHIQAKASNGRKTDFLWESWGTRAFSYQELKPAVDDLKVTKFKQFTHNFLRFNTAPAKLDWFDDFSAITNNSRLAARVAREGGCKGLLFDIEQYVGPLFNYPKQRDASTKTWEQYAAQVRQRGREVMEAFQAEFPNMTVFLTFGYSLPWSQTQSGKKPLAECSYGLLAPFIDGLLEGTHGKVKLIDGYELAYGYKEPAQFTEAYKTMSQTLLPIVAIRKSIATYSRSALVCGSIAIGARAAGTPMTSPRTISRPKRSSAVCAPPSTPPMNTCGFTAKRRAGGPKKAGQSSSRPRTTKRRDVLASNKKTPGDLRPEYVS